MKIAMIGGSIAIKGIQLHPLYEIKVISKDHAFVYP